MSTNPPDFLDVARILTTYPSEAATRSAISRAYYAAYHSALTILSPAERRASDRLRTRHGPHDAVWGYFAQLGNAESQDIADTGRILHQARIRADYSLAEAISVAEMAVALDDATTLIAALQNHTPRL